MHKSRMFLSPIPDFSPGGYDLYNPKVRFATVPRASLHITGDFAALVAPIVDCAIQNAGQTPAVPADHILVPIHELQSYHIRAKFPDVEVLPPQYAVLARAQQSIRCAFCAHVCHPFAPHTPTQLYDPSERTRRDVSQARRRD
jgi:hypothetical protein